MGNRHLKEGTLLDERYLIQGVLGEGGFGITYAAENRRISLKVAVKELFWREHVRREATDLSVRTETTEDRARTAADAISSSADVTSAQADRDRAATGEATPAEMTGMRSALL